MIPNWTNHLKDQEEKERFKRHIFNSRSVLERQNAMLDDLEKEQDLFETSREQYKNPAWAALQADGNGFRRALRLVKKINNLDQKEIE